MQEETIKLLGKRTIINSDENGTTGYTIFTATSLYDSYCVDASKTNYFDFSCSDNTIGILCNDTGNLVPYLTWNNDLRPFLKNNASFVKLNDSDLVGVETNAYACKVIFPPSFGISNPNAVLDFKVTFKARTSDGENMIEMTQEYHIAQCVQS